MKRASDRLLVGYLEGIGWRVFQKYPIAIHHLTRGRTGVYALYKGERLSYVGLASNLMWRLKAHLRDRHAGRWDRFSVYVTHGDRHLREIESILLRIAKPTGNKVKGGLKGCPNLYRQLRREMTESDADNRAALLGGHAAQQRRRRKAKRGRGSLGLAGLVDRRLPLKASYKNRMFRASLRRDGYISYRGTLFESPTAAAKKASGRGMNGWSFWRYKRSAGDWPRLRDLKR
jgi:hypothetical protein